MLDVKLVDCLSSQVTRIAPDPMSTRPPHCFLPQAIDLARWSSVQQFPSVRGMTTRSVHAAGGFRDPWVSRYH